MISEIIMFTGFDASGVVHVNSSLPFVQQRASEEGMHIEIPFLTAVRSTDSNGVTFEEWVALDTMSTGLLSFRLRRDVPRDVRLFACVRLSSSPTNGHLPWVAFVGRVISTEIRPGHVFRTAVRIARYRFVQMSASVDHA